MAQAEVDLLQVVILVLVETVVSTAMQVDIIKIMRLHLQAVLHLQIQVQVVAAVVKPLR